MSFPLFCGAGETGSYCVENLSGSWFLLWSPPALREVSMIYESSLTNRWINLLLNSLLTATTQAEATS